MNYIYLQIIKISRQYCHNNRMNLNIQPTLFKLFGTSEAQRLKLSILIGVGSLEIYYLTLKIAKCFFLCNTAGHAGTLRINRAILNFRFHDLHSATCIDIRDQFIRMWWHMQNTVHNVDILFKMCIKFKL